MSWGKYSTSKNICKKELTLNSQEALRNSNVVTFKHNYFSTL